MTASKDITGPADYPENDGTSTQFARHDDPLTEIVRELTKEHDVISGQMRVSNMSRIELEDRQKQIDVGRRHGIASIMQRGYDAISGAPGRDGERARELISLGGSGAAQYAARPRTGLRGLWDSVTGRTHTEPVIPPGQGNAAPG